jgi:hypothetical protein
VGGQGEAALQVQQPGQAFGLDRRRHLIRQSRRPGLRPGSFILAGQTSTLAQVFLIPR